MKKDASISITPKSPDAAFLIGIEGLPIELCQVRQGCLYWLHTESEVDAISLCRQSLVCAQADDRMVLVSTDDHSDILSEYPADCGPAVLHFYRLKARRICPLPVLVKDLDRVLSLHKRLVLLLLPIEMVLSELEALQTLLSSWAGWVTQNSCVLVLLTYGLQSLQDTSLLPLNHILSGAASLRRDSADYAYYVSYWRNALGAFGPAELPLQRIDQTFVVREYSDSTGSVASDREQVIFDACVLEGMPISMAEAWRTAENTEQLVALALRASAATIVFCLEDPAKIDSLARTLHTIRRQRGKFLKLVVREMQPVLRSLDEHLLVACGVNIVVPVGTHLSRFFSLLQAVQGQVFHGELIPDPEPLIRARYASKLRGMIHPHAWIEYVDGLLVDDPNWCAPGTIVCLRPVSGLSMELISGQLEMRRDGDVACDLDGVMYLFLFGCPPHMVNVALRTIFCLPVEHIFSEYWSYGQISQMRDQSAAMKRIMRSSVSQSSDNKIPATLGRAGGRRVAVDIERIAPRNLPAFNPVLHTLKLVAPK
ncbi:cellulose biosynthesis protein BcsE [Alcaligenaceae bacterium CGII-47]|nr:cellulose biosynthesis protein BcsE [Alcaligenaceae bacterium CGII-47]